MPTPEEFGKLIAEKWELLAAAIVILGGSGLVGGIIATVRKRQQTQRQRQIASGEFPFLVVKPYSVDVVKQLMEGLGSRADDPLADFNIRYQVRQQGKNVRQDLERSFEQKPWVIILGRSGLGKTREAAHLAQGLSEEGWTVLKLMEQGWLDVPRQFPEVISPQDKLLFVIDDLNRWIRAGNPREIHRDAEDLTQPLRVSVQERILRVLEFFEQECRAEVRVIATARNEPEEREKLQFEKYPQFWQRFQQYELAQPEDGAIVRLLDDRAQEANISANPADFPVLASRSDGTFRNMVENLRTVQFRNQPLLLDTVGESLERTWRKRYNDAVKRHPAAKYIYDAVELLQLLNVPLSAELVQKTAVLLVRGNGLKRLRQQWQIRQASLDLIQTEQILQPRDGQIEGKGRSVDAAFIPKVLLLLLSSQALTASDFFAIGISLSLMERYEEALISFNQALQPQPDSYLAWYFRGNALTILGRHEEALASYDQAIHHKPDDFYTWHGRGTALLLLERHEEAVTSYDRALHYQPDFHLAWVSRGIALFLLERHEEAVTSYDRALHYQPDFHLAWASRGNALLDLGLLDLERYEEAITNYDQALHYKPDDHATWYFRGYTLLRLERYEEAVASFNQALHHKLDYHEAWTNRGNALDNLGQPEAALFSYDKALAIQPDDVSAIYNKACIYGLQGQIEQAVSCLRQAIFLYPGCREMAETDADFDAIREDDLFQAMMKTSAEENRP